MGILTVSRSTTQAAILLTCCACALACGADPPAYSTDADDAAIYAGVTAATRQSFEIEGRMSVHPYLAVA
ncbi:MAG TPA: hypothetical protein VHG09_14895, partial [Longimicrobiales bacterium]|nr:hypothetical protein [Longimicrobiales bacterium]